MSDSKSVLVLGAGFGGLTVCNELRRRLPPEHRITVIDNKNHFVMGLSKLWIMDGRRKPGAEGRGDLTKLSAKGISFLNEEILAIDVRERRVKTKSEELSADYIIVALGAHLNPEGIPGFEAAALNLYDLESVSKVHEKLQEFKKGKITILISRTPFKCPPAPYEAAMLIDSLLRNRNLRKNVELSIYTPEPQPMPIAGKEVGNQIKQLLQEREIRYFPNHKINQIDAISRNLKFDQGESRFDLLIAVPPHVAPKVVRDAGLTDESGWIPVDKSTLATKFPNIFAIGDVTAIKLPNAMLLPKAGVFAEAEGKIVVDEIVGDILGKKTLSKFDGNGHCFVEVGGGKAAIGSGGFYETPNPKITLKAPSSEGLEEKIEFERSRLGEWI